MKASKRIARKQRRAAPQAHPAVPAQHSGDSVSGQEIHEEDPQRDSSTYLQVHTENQKTWTEPGLQVKYKEPTEEEIAALAHQLWQLRGCPEGSPEDDWYCALEALRAGIRFE